MILELPSTLWFIGISVFSFPLVYQPLRLSWIRDIEGMRILPLGLLCPCLLQLILPILSCTGLQPLTSSLHPSWYNPNWPTLVANLKEQCSSLKNNPWPVIPWTWWTSTDLLLLQPCKTFCPPFPSRRTPSKPSRGQHYQIKTYAHRALVDFLLHLLLYERDKQETTCLFYSSEYTQHSSQSLILTWILIMFLSWK